MECYPACRVCSGLCKEPDPAPVRVPPVRPPAGRDQRSAKRGARGSFIPPEVLANRSYYIRLRCDHYTTTEDQGLFRSIRVLLPEPVAKGLFYFCDKCDMWVDKFHYKNSAVLPESPEGLF